MVKGKAERASLLVTGGWDESRVTMSLRFGTVN